jgi:hypothetical protein
LDVTPTQDDEVPGNVVQLKGLDVSQRLRILQSQGVIDSRAGASADDDVLTT